MCFCLLSYVAKAQEKPMSIDVQMGLPVGDVEEFTDFHAGFNFTYLFTEFTENFHVGGRAGINAYSNAFRKLDPFVDQEVYFINLAFVAQYNLKENIFGRLDVGYALGVDGNSDGGIFYEPRIGYLFNNFETFIYYQHIIDDESKPMAVGLGVGYRF